MLLVRPDRPSLHKGSMVFWTIHWWTMVGSHSFLHGSHLSPGFLPSIPFPRFMWSDLTQRHGLCITLLRFLSTSLFKAAALVGPSTWGGMRQMETINPLNVSLSLSFTLPGLSAREQALSGANMWWRQAGRNSQPLDADILPQHFLWWQSLHAEPFMPHSSEDKSGGFYSHRDILKRCLPLTPWNVINNDHTEKQMSE